MNQRRHLLFVIAAGSLCLAAVLFQAGIWLWHPRWFKGNLHAHSDRNGGDASPAEVARWYRNQRYQFVALSDDAARSDRSARAEEIPNRFLVLDATEVSGQAGIHVNGIGVQEPVVARVGLSRRSSLFDNVEAVREAGGLPGVIHPQVSELTFGDLMHLDGDFLLEINEGRPRAPEPPPGVPSAEQMWDDLLSVGRTVYAVAADDASYFRTAGRETGIPGTGWIAVRAGALDGDSILGAIRRGEFYASTGVALNDVRWDGRVLQVTINGAMGGRYRTTFIGAHSRVLSTTLANPAVYLPSPGDGYVRARIEGEDGRLAWTQAVRVAPVNASAPKTFSVANNAGSRIEASLDSAPLDGPVEQIPPYNGASLECDQPPSNGAQSGARILADRRSVRGGAYESAKSRWVSAQRASSDLDTVTREVRARYQAAIGRHLSARTVTAVEARPFVFRYPARYAGNAKSVSIRVKAITLHTIDDAGRKGTLAAYFLNYDRAADRSRHVVLVSTPHVPANVLLGITTEGVFSGLAGKLAVAGVPVLVYDPTGTGGSSRFEEWQQRMYLEAADLQVIDAALLSHFDRVDLVGSTETLAHLLVSHQSRIGSAYLVHFIPLWTRNDAGPRTGGPFGTDEDSDHVVFQSQFQWADFLLTAIHDRVRLALALNTGSSGLGKAGLLDEVVPALRRFTTSFEIRGDDPDGDGFSRSKPPVCAGFDVADVREFLGM